MPRDGSCDRFAWRRWRMPGPNRVPDLLNKTRFRRDGRVFPSVCAHRLLICCLLPAVLADFTPAVIYRGNSVKRTRSIPTSLSILMRLEPIMAVSSWACPQKIQPFERTGRVSMDKPTVRSSAPTDGAEPEFDPRDLRNALGCFATGVTIITATRPW